MVAMEAEADDCSPTDDGFEITADPTLFGIVSEALESAGFKAEKAEIDSLPKTTVTLDDPVNVKKLVRIIGILDDLDDVQGTSTNLEWTAAALEAAEDA